MKIKYLIVCVSIVAAVVAARSTAASRAFRAGTAVHQSDRLPNAPVCDPTDDDDDDDDSQG